MPDIKAQKNQLRAKFRQMRGSSDDAARRAADRQIQHNVTALNEYQAARLMLCYVSADSEPDTLRLMVQAMAEGKSVACPRCDKASHTMSFYKISSLEDLSPGAYGIFEPPADAPEAQPEEMQNSICIVPGLAFDPWGGRLGYGGGYYDRFLAGYGGITVGLCREETCSAQPLPRDVCDIPVDMVVTERRISNCRSSPEPR